MTQEELKETEEVPLNEDVPAIEEEKVETPQEERVVCDLPYEERPAMLQALFFAHSEPLSTGRLSEITGLTKEEVKESLEALDEYLEDDLSGFELNEIGGGYQLRTKVKFAPYIRLLKAEKPKRLSTPALETLAIVAYKQPVVKSDIEKIRGVDSTPTIKTLLERKLIRIVGYQNTVGQPALYGTTDEFLKIFGLKGLPDLPGLREVVAIERDPGEVVDERQQELGLEK